MVCFNLLNWRKKIVIWCHFLTPQDIPNMVELEFPNLIFIEEIFCRKAVVMVNRVRLSSDNLNFPVAYFHTFTFKEI